MRDPPDPPSARSVSPSSVAITIGAVLESGRLPGAGKLNGEGRRPKASGMSGVANCGAGCGSGQSERGGRGRERGGLTSSISSLRMMPVVLSITREPNRRLTVEVTETAEPDLSITDRWVVP